MRYSKSLDLVICALAFARKGQMEKAAKCFDKALTMKDLGVTLAALEKHQVKAHAAVTAAMAKVGTKPTTAQLLTALAAKRAEQAAKAKAKKPKVKPKAKAKKVKAEFGEDTDGLDDVDVDDDSFGDLADSMTVSNGEADDDTPAGGDFGGGMTAEVDDTDGEDEVDADLDGTDDFDIDGMDDGVDELPEASVEDVDVGFLDTMDNSDANIPSVDGEGQPGDELTETSDVDGDDDEDDLPGSTEDDDDDAEAAKVEAKAKARQIAAKQAQRVQANLAALARLNKGVKAKSKK